MNDMNIISPQELAHRINSELHLGLTPRPWNLHNPSETFYWLVPSTDWPAYRYGKFAFSLPTDNPRKPLLGMNDALLDTETIFVGLNIEKGFGPLAIEVDKTLRRKKQIMDPEWRWSNVVDADGATRFARMLADASNSVDVHLYVVSSYVHDREDPIRPKQDAVMFSCHSSQIRVLLHNNYQVGVLRGIDEMTDFNALAAWLRQIDDYHWVDLYVGTHVQKGEIDLHNLNAGVLSHFQPWVI